MAEIHEEVVTGIVGCVSRDSANCWSVRHPLFGKTYQGYNKYTSKRCIGCVARDSVVAARLGTLCLEKPSEASNDMLKRHSIDQPAGLPPRHPFSSVVEEPPLWLLLVVLSPWWLLLS